MRSARRLASGAVAGRFLREGGFFVAFAMPPSYALTAAAVEVARGAVSRTGHSLQGGCHDVGVHADAPQHVAVAGFRLDVAHRLGVLAGAGGMLMVIAHLDPDAA